MLSQELLQEILEDIKSSNFPIPQIHNHLVSAYSENLKSYEIDELFHKLSAFVENYIREKGVLLPLVSISQLLYLKMMKHLEIKSFEADTFAGISAEENKLVIAFNKNFFEEVLKGKEISSIDYLKEMNKLLEHEFGHSLFKHIDKSYVKNVYENYVYNKIKTEIGENSAKLIDYLFKNEKFAGFINTITNIIGDLLINYQFGIKDVFGIPGLHPDTKEKEFYSLDAKFTVRVENDEEFMKRIPKELDLDTSALRNELITKLKEEVLGKEIEDKRIGGILNRIRLGYSDLKEHFYDIFLFALFAYFVFDFVKGFKPYDEIEPGEYNSDETNEKIKIVDRKLHGAAIGRAGRITEIEITPIKVILPITRIELYASDEVKSYKNIVKKRTYRRVREYPGEVEIPLRLRQKLKFLYFIVDTSGSVMDVNSLKVIAGSIATLSQNFYIFLCIFSDIAEEYDLGKKLETTSIRNIFKKFKIYSRGTQLISALEKMINRKVKKGVIISDFELGDKDLAIEMVKEHKLRLFGIIINDSKRKEDAIETAKEITRSYVFIDVNDLK